jgi:uncharacterized membrane protein (UPF0127 family)
MNNQSAVLLLIGLILTNSVTVYQAFCPSHAPSTDSQYVLETVSGFAQRHNIGLGTEVKIDLMR